MNDPLVSIVIPVYNGSNYLASAINSALAQTYKNVEIIVVNDGSTDGGATEALAKSYGDRIKYYYKENGGVATALNFAISVMEGNYFSWLSHDDEYLPSKVQAQIDFSRKLDIRDSIIYSGFEIIDEDSRKIDTVVMPIIKPVDFRYWITRASMLHGCTLLVPRQCFSSVGLFNPHLRTTQDYDLWFRMAASTPFFGMPEILIRARRHGEQGTKTLVKVALEECNELHISFLKQLFTDGYFKNYTTSEKELKLSTIILSYKERGFIRAYRFAVAAAFWESLGFDPFALLTVTMAIMVFFEKCNFCLVTVRKNTGIILSKLLKAKKFAKGALKTKWRK